MLRLSNHGWKVGKSLYIPVAAIPAFEETSTAGERVAWLIAYHRPEQLAGWIHALETNAPIPDTSWAHESTLEAQPASEILRLYTLRYRVEQSCKQVKQLGWAEY